MALTFAEHAHQLAVAFKKRLIETPKLRPEEAFAYPPLEAAFVGTIHDETTYAVALHELGHLCAPSGVLHEVSGNKLNLRRDEEDAAWKWARHYAMFWTPVMETLSQWCEGTYADDPPAPVEAPTPPAPVVPPTRIDWKDWK